MLMAETVGEGPGIEVVSAIELPTCEKGSVFLFTNDLEVIATNQVLLKTNSFNYPALSYAFVSANVKNVFVPIANSKGAGQNRYVIISRH